MDLIRKDLENFTANKNSIEIQFSKVYTERFGGLKEGTFDEKYLYTRVIPKFNSNRNQEKGKIDGEFVLMLRNQGEDKDMALYVNVHVYATTQNDYSHATILDRVVDYLFDWTKKYVNDNDIVDQYGKLFIMPTSHFTPDCFIKAFQWD